MARKNFKNTNIEEIATEEKYVAPVEEIKKETSSVEENEETKKVEFEVTEKVVKEDLKVKEGTKGDDVLTSFSDYDEKDKKPKEETKKKNELNNRSRLIWEELYGSQFL